MPPATATTAQAEPIVCPFTVVVDTREQHPWSFRRVSADARQDNRPLVVRTVRNALPTGDYSIEGLESQVTIERKSLADAYGTFGGGRDRWERELERMASFSFAAVVIEAGWPSILHYTPPHESASGRRFTGKMFYRSVIAWQQRHGNVHWWFCDTLDFAERTAFRMLERFWVDEIERQKAVKAEQIGA